MGTKYGAIEAKLILLRYKVEKQQKIKIPWLTYKDITCDKFTADRSRQHGKKSIFAVDLRWKGRKLW